MSSVTPVKLTPKLRWRFNYGANREKLDAVFAHFAPGGFLSEYSYTVVDANDAMTVFDVYYDSETDTAHDVYLMLDLVYRSLELKLDLI